MATKLTQIVRNTVKGTVIMNTIYYLVYVGDRPLSLVKTCSIDAKFIAGREIGLAYFDGDQPNTLVDLAVCFEQIATQASHPAIGKWIDRLRKSGSRKKPKILTDDERAEVIKLKQQGAKLKHLAERFGVSVSTIKRLNP